MRKNERNQLRSENHHSQQAWQAGRCGPSWKSRPLATIIDFYFCSKPSHASQEELYKYLRRAKGANMKTKEINWELKIAIASKFGRQLDAARALGIKESRLSYIVHGHVNPSPSENEALAKGLGREFIGRLFPSHTIINEKEKQNHAKRK
jgi:transcriptional regulator with XRE-family HTH domain